MIQSERLDCSLQLISLLLESMRSGAIASLAMMTLGFLFKFAGLRVGHYGPKLAALLFNEPTPLLQLAQHIVIGWLSTQPLLTDSGIFGVSVSVFMYSI